MIDVVVVPANVRDPRFVALMNALTAELAAAKYPLEQTFGYPTEELMRRGVHVVAATRAEALVGIGGVEMQSGGYAELKRFYVVPCERGTGVADRILSALLEYALTHGANALRLETGNKQLAAQAFYRRHGFVDVPRFAPYEASETSVCMQRGLAYTGGVTQQ
jgi:putative acetyltransferase